MKFPEEKKMRLPFSRASVLVLLLLFSLSPLVGNSQEIIKIAILPVTMHSLENLEPLKEGLVDMLSSRIDLEGKIIVIEKEEVRKAVAGVKEDMNQAVAREVGLKVGADYVLFSSLTKLGEAVSLDAKLIELKTGKVASTIFVQSKSLDEIVPKVGEFAQKVQEKILGHPIEMARPLEAQPPARTAAPIPAPLAEAPAAKALETKPSRITQDFWMSQALAFEVKGMGVGDVDGDGKNEIVLIDSHNVWIYRWEGELRLVKKIPGDTYHDYLAVDVADVNKNGQAEIFVTSMWKTKLESFVLEHDRGDFKIIASNLDWHLRIVDLSQQGSTLIGQQSSLDNPFYGPIYELGWDGKQYLKKRKLSFAKAMNIYGLAEVQFKDGGPARYLYIDGNQYLTLVSQEGKVLWQSNDRFGTNNFIIGKPKITTSMVEESDWIPVNVRILVKDGGGQREILLSHNYSMTGQFIKRFQLYNRGEIQRFSWNGTILDMTWRSKEIGGYIADCQFQDVDGDQKKELVGAVALWRDVNLTGSKQSAVVVFKQ